MTITPTSATQISYEPLPTADKADGAESTFTEVTFTDDSIPPEEPHDRKEHHTLETSSLSRNTASSWYFIAHGAVDAFLAVGPIFFFILAGLCLGLNGHPKSDYGDNIKAVTLLSPTIFPIVYAAILGKLLHRIGLYKAERGVTMGDLERLTGCQSVFSTLERLIGLRHVDLLGVAILLAWLLSPLGGQASLRLLSIEQLITVSNSTVLYYPVGLYASQTVLPLKQSNATMSTAYTPLFIAALQTSRHNIDTPADLFGNVRIPDINAFNTSRSRTQGNDGNDWRYVQNSSDLSYTSVFGVPVAGVPRVGNVSFPLITHYWSINCTVEDDLKGPSSWDRVKFPNDTKLSNSKPQSPSFDLILNQNSTDDDIRFRFLSRTSENITTISAVSTQCNAKPTVVESWVSCRDGACRVRAMRQQKLKPGEIWNGTSPLTIFKALCKYMPGADMIATQDASSESELIERWIRDPMLSLQDVGAFIDLSRFQKNIFIYRLQMVINTFWDSTVGNNEIHMDVLDKEKYVVLRPAWTTTDIGTTKYEGLYYICHIKLAGITMAISFVLLLAANLSLLLGIFTRTPDVLGFVSMNARDNAHFSKYVPSHLDGKETARALRNVRVIIGDVKGEAEVGHIALTTMDARPRRLSWTRHYD